MTAAGAKAKPADMAAVALNNLPRPTCGHKLAVQSPNRKIALKLDSGCTKGTPKSAKAEALSKASASPQAVGRKSPSPNAATTPPKEAPSELVDASSPAPLHTTVAASSDLASSSPAKEVNEDGLKRKQEDVEAAEDDQMKEPKGLRQFRHRLVQSYGSFDICEAEDTCPGCGFPRPVQTGATQLAEALEEARSLKTQLEEARSLKKSVRAGETQTCKVRLYSCKKMPVGGGFKQYKTILVADKKEQYLGKKATEISKLASEAWRNAEEKVKRPFVHEFRAKLVLWKRQRSLNAKALAGNMGL
jgi:hypothetical protein